MIDPVVLHEWHAVGLADRLATGARLDTRLLGVDLEIARAADGTLRGSVSGRGGEAQTVRLTERFGFLWASLGTPQRPWFAIHELDDGLGRRFVPWGAIRVHTSAPRIIENFIDLGHFPFVHPGSLGAEPWTAVADYAVAVDPATRELWATDCKMYQPKAAAALSSGAEIGYRFRVVRPFAALFYKSSVLYPDRDNVSGLFVQPVGEDESIAHAFSCVFNERDSDTAIRHFSQEIFAQDRPILEGQSPARLPLDAGAEKPVRSDAMSIAYRRWLDGLGLTYGVLRGAEASSS